MLYFFLTRSSNRLYRPQNPRELFNLWHSMARNVVERIFGTLKRRFSLMVASPEYSENKQAKFVSALCVLHNFISVYDRDDVDINIRHQPPSGMCAPPQAASTELPRPAWISEEEELSASGRRDKIADEMWADYQQYLAERNIGAE